MNSRYLCKHHFHVYCQDLAKAQQDWERSMAMGLEAVNAQTPQTAERCFGTAYDIANIIFARQISHCSETDNAANTLLSAQYLATNLVQQRYPEKAQHLLNQLHEKFSFVCRNPAVNKSLREMLCNCLIPYLEKLYQLTLQEPAAKSSSPSCHLNADKPTLSAHEQKTNKRPNPGFNYWQGGSNLYH